jgi:hypothetical protein
MIIRDLSTGLDDSTGHPIWRLVEAPVGAPGTPAYAVTVPIFDSWIDLSPASWISASTGCGLNNPGCPGGDYTYETCWCSCQADTSGTVSVDVAADNQAAVFINNILAPGGAIPTPTPPGTEFKGTAHVAFSYAPGAERNCLQIRVTNFSAGATALDVMGSVTMRAIGTGECAGDILPATATPTATPTRTATPTKTTIVSPPT